MKPFLSIPLIALATLLWAGAALAEEKTLAEMGFVTTASGLMYKDFTVGEGDEAKPGLTVAVHYTGMLGDGTVFDSSKGKKAFVFKIGAGMVIKGWDEGVAGMKVGGSRRLIIPPNLGYGDRGAGKVIPPGATLTFDVQLMAVKK